MFSANIIGDPTNIYDLCFRDSSVEDLGLDFTLPGYNDYILACGPDYVTVGEYFHDVGAWCFSF